MVASITTGSSHSERGSELIYMKQLWGKIEPDLTRPRHLLTETGVGYRLVTDTLLTG